MLELEEYLRNKIEVIPESISPKQINSTATLDFRAVSKFLSTDITLHRFQFEDVYDLNYPIIINLVSSNITFNQFKIGNSSDFDDFADLLIEHEIPQILATVDGEINSEIIEMAGDRNVPLLLISSDVPLEEVDKLENVIIVKNTNFIHDPPDRAICLDFAGDWLKRTNSTIDPSFILPSKSYETVSTLAVVTLIILSRLILSRTRLIWLISRLSCFVAIIFSLWFNTQNACCCCGSCGCR